MNRAVDGLLSTYESGKISRRELIVSLSALALAPHRLRAQESSIRAESLNHVTLYVSDVERSEQFYRDLLGLSVMSYQGDGVNLALGDSFIGIYDAAARNVEPHINHICVGIDGFDQANVEASLADRGVASEVRMRNGTIPQIFVSDPDNLRIQLQDVSYCGGSGPLGNVCAESIE